MNDLRMDGGELKGSSLYKTEAVLNIDSSFPTVFAHSMQ
jgi:hypothetical protein